ncbi:MAG: hypothetical protein ACRYGM_05300 [Janthinobacterium lividum]
MIFHLIFPSPAVHARRQLMEKSSMAYQPNPVLLPLRKGCRDYGFGVTKAYEMIAAGILDARKAGRHTVLTVESLNRYAESLPKLQTKKAG